MYMSPYIYIYICIYIYIYTFAYTLINPGPGPRQGILHHRPPKGNPKRGT